jgi:hypothetical protein
MMYKFVIVGNSGDKLLIEAEKFTINGEFVVFTREETSLVELDPLPREAFVAACKDIFFFQAVDEEGNPITIK